MGLVAIADFLLTLLTLASLAAGGYLGALALLPAGLWRDSLLLAIAALTCMTAEGVLIGLALGVAGRLALPWALSAQWGLVLLLLAVLHRRAGSAGGLGWLAATARRLAERTRVHLTAQPALSLALLHAAGSEAARGLLRPPLSWDSLMYHLLLAATWLQEQAITPFFGPYPLNVLGLTPANGSIWLWWWLAPSHSDLYANLAFLPHWVLFGLAVGAIARELGAARAWPLGAAVALLAPVVVRFAATQYVDLYLASLLLTGAMFTIRWLGSASWHDAWLAGTAFGVALGAKGLGLPYVVVLSGALALTARGAWSRRSLQVLAALTAALLLGSYFWVRNMSLGLGLLFPIPNPFQAVPCDPLLDNPALAGTRFRDATLWAKREWMLSTGILTDAFLGTTWPGGRGLEIGPPALVFATALLALPLAVPGGRRGVALALQASVAAMLVLWATVPVAFPRYIFANVRYLVPALGLGASALAVLMERARVPTSWASAFVLALVFQHLLNLHAQLPRELRIATAWLDVVAAAFLVVPTLRALVGRPPVRRTLATAGVVAVLLAVPWFDRYRAQDRYRAFAEEFTAHPTPAGLHAAAWAWLDRHGGSGTVSVVAEPETLFFYPAMGHALQRRVVYTNVAEPDVRNVRRYPNCNPRRVPFHGESWVRNLRRHNVRWVLLSRQGPSFPQEEQWVRTSPLFALRFADQHNLLYELRPDP